MLLSICILSFTLLQKSQFLPADEDQIMVTSRLGSQSIIVIE